MPGLLTPTQGRILLDGQDITQIGLTQYRQQIAVVIQDDTLLSGSIADNLTFFEPELNYLRMQQCAQLAAIDSDISKMTMGYNTLVCVWAAEYIRRSYGLIQFFGRLVSNREIDGVHKKYKED